MISLDSAFVPTESSPAFASCVEDDELMVVARHHCVAGKVAGLSWLWYPCGWEGDYPEGRLIVF